MPSEYEPPLMLLHVQLGSCLMLATIADIFDIANAQHRPPWSAESTDDATHVDSSRVVRASKCLTNKEAYRRNGCCAGTCGDTYTTCFDCPTTQEQDPLNYGGPSCFLDGSCIANTPAGSCAAPSVKEPRGDETEYAGWCECPEGSFCNGDGCSKTAPRQLWNADEVSVLCLCINETNIYPGVYSLFVFFSLSPSISLLSLPSNQHC